MPMQLNDRENHQKRATSDEVVEHAKAIRADAFDKFIEEQLQRGEFPNGNSEYELVCHVY